MSQFTAQDAKDLKMPLELLREWERVMNGIWKCFLYVKKKQPNVEIVNHENVIHFQEGKKKFLISVDFVNNIFLRLSIKIDGSGFWAEVSHINKFSEEGIIRIVGNIIAYAQNIKP